MDKDKLNYRLWLIMGGALLAAILFYSIPVNLDYTRTDLIRKQKSQSKIINFYNREFLAIKYKSPVFERDLYYDFYNPPEKVELPRKEDSFEEYVGTESEKGRRLIGYNKFIHGKRVDTNPSEISARQDTLEMLINKYNEN